MKKKIIILLAMALLLSVNVMSVSAAERDVTTFDYVNYADTYPDLKAAFGYDPNLLYTHYITCGIAEGRVGRFTTDAPIDTVITAPFKVYNNTGKPVVDIFMAESSATDWGRDLIESTKYTRMFDTRYISVNLQFNPTKTYDFFIRCKDGTEFEAAGLSMESGTAEGGTIHIFADEVVFIPQGVADPYGPKPGYVRQLVKIYNNTGKSIVDVYIAESGTNQWSKDLMEQSGSKRARNRQYFEATFEMTNTKTYDLFIRSEDGSEDIATGLDLSDLFGKGGNIHIRQNDVVWVAEGENDPYKR